MNSEIKSEVFDDSYCIFIDMLDVVVYKNTVQKYKNEGVKIFEGNFEKAPACIVIPNKLDIFKIENELFDIEESKNGFWRQFGMGYKGKTWKEI